MRLLFVCSGNICRSPTAEAVMRQLVETAGAGIEVDSAGTGGWHAGEPPDRRSTAAAARAGITLTGVARQVTPADFTTFDLILAVDDHNLRELRWVTPPGATAVVRRLDGVDVPDPYHGGESGFDDVLDQVTAACTRLLADLTKSA
jgi:protein-tyrosine phosphatase